MVSPPNSCHDWDETEGWSSDHKDRPNWTEFQEENREKKHGYQSMAMGIQSFIICLILLNLSDVIISCKIAPDSIKTCQWQRFIGSLAVTCMLSTLMHLFLRINWHFGENPGLLSGNYGSKSFLDPPRIESWNIAQCPKSKHQNTRVWPNKYRIFPKSTARFTNQRVDISHSSAIDISIRALERLVETPSFWHPKVRFFPLYIIGLRAHDGNDILLALEPW